MDFITHYQAISDNSEKRSLRNRIIKACCIQHSTFYSWIHRSKIPLLAQEKIAEIMEQPQKELFPESKYELSE